MEAASHENEISYRAFCQLGGCLNSSLTSVERSNGGHRYQTYHHIGGGQAYWKQDKPQGPN